MKLTFNELVILKVALRVLSNDLSSAELKFAADELLKKVVAELDSREKAMVGGK